MMTVEIPVVGEVTAAVNVVASVANGAISVINDIREHKSLADVGMDVLNTALAASGTGAGGEAGEVSAGSRAAVSEGESAESSPAAAADDTLQLPAGGNEPIKYSVNEAPEDQGWDANSLPSNRDAREPNVNNLLPKSPLPDGIDDWEKIQAGAEQLPDLPHPGHPEIKLPKPADGGYGYEHPFTDPMIIAAAAVAHVGAQVYKVHRNGDEVI